jgi:hypothetical protein
MGGTGVLYKSWQGIIQNYALGEAKITPCRAIYIYIGQSAHTLPIISQPFPFEGKNKLKG